MIGIGSVVNGKYRLVRLLGDGGMGAVYEAQHSALGTRVAIKVLHAELARRTGLVERFMQEARVAAQIRSPYVVQVTDVDRTADGQAYIVMELLEGEPLSSVLDRQRKLPVATACAYTLQILAALEAAHALGVIHRDLKPENVFVTFLAGRPVLKLIDFGIAKVRRLDPRQKNLTVAGVVMGTAEYMAPEQARSADKVDARADIYAAGVILYELIAGSRPVPGDEAHVIAMRVERGEAVPLVQVAPDVPRDVAGLVHRAMAARPELRFATATEMRLALEASVSGVKRPGTAALQAGSHSAGPAPALDGTRTAGRMAAAAPPPAPTSAGGPPSQAPEEPPVRTMRAPPLASALAPPAYAGAAVPASPQVSEGARRRRRNPGAVVALVAVPIFLGAGVVGVFLASGTSASSPPPAPLFPATAAADEAGIEPVAAATATQPSPNSEVPSLLPAKPVYVAQHPPPSPSAHAVSSAGVDAGAPTAAPFLLPTILPSVFPSSLPPFPSMLPPFPTSLPTTLPTTLPTVFPSALPAWPPPAAEPSASAPSPPHPSNPGY